jgi:hypothetical protein
MTANIVDAPGTAPGFNLAELVNSIYFTFSA